MRINGLPVHNWIGWRTRGARAAALTLAALAACVLPAQARAADPLGSVTEFSAGITGHGVYGMDLGPEGNLWFTEDTSGIVARITPTGTVTEFTAGIAPGLEPIVITTGPEGNLWFGQCCGGDVGRITPTGTVTEFSSGITAGSEPDFITTGPEGNLWFTEYFDRIGRITPTGTVTEFSSGITSGAHPAYIVTGPEGNLWFTEFGGNRVARITPTGTVTEFSSGITPASEPVGIAVGSDGNIWFTQFSGDEIGRITPSGTVTEFSAGLPAGANPYVIAKGPEGDLWFTAEGSNEIGRITPAGTIRMFGTGITPSSQPIGIAEGPEGDMWFAQWGSTQVGRFGTAPPGPYWTSNGKVIPPGQVEPVTSSGTLKLHALGSTITCKVTDNETIENTAGHGPGVDQLTALTFSGCISKPPLCPVGQIVEVVAKGLPWATVLVASASLTDEIRGIDLEVRCSGSGVLATFSGSLAPVLGKSKLEFGTASGSLTSPSGQAATISGNDALKGPTGDTSIAAEVAEPFPHWYSNGKRLAEATREPVATSGTLTFRIGAGGGGGEELGGSTFSCHVADQELIENPAGGATGIDEVTAATFSKCTGKPSPCLKGQTLSLLATGLPWASQLLATTPIEDEIKGVEVEILCNGAFFDRASGTLTPSVGTSVLSFGPGAGHLEDINKTAVEVSGNDALKGPLGDTSITAMDP